MARFVEFFAWATIPGIGLAALERYAINYVNANAIGVPLLAKLCAPLTLGNIPLTLGTFTIPKAVGFIGLVNVGASALLMFGLGLKVALSRKDCGVDYPKMYSNDKEGKGYLFDCIQRGHQNALESYPQFLAASLVGGLRHPFLTAAAGALWIAARVYFMKGYATGVPDKRFDVISRQHFKALFATFITAISASCGILGLF